MIARIAGTAAVLALAAAGIAAALTWQPPPPTDCAVLFQQAEQRSDAGALIAEAGCDEPSTTAGHDLTARPLTGGVPSGDPLPPSEQPMTTAPEPYTLSHLMPAPSTPVAPTVNIEDVIWRQIQTMQAQGWTLYQRWPGGADFSSVTPPTISTGVHIILTVFTVGAWLIIWILMELLGGGSSTKWCRLTVDGEGQPHYETIGRPQPAA